MRRVELTHRRVELGVCVFERLGVLRDDAILESSLHRRESLAQLCAEPRGRIIAVADAGHAVAAQDAEGDRHDEDRKHRDARDLGQQSDFALDAQLARRPMERRERRFPQRICGDLPRLTRSERGHYSPTRTTFTVPGRTAAAET